MTTNALLYRANSLSRAARNGPTARVRKHSFHDSRAAQAIMMPAMSPLMTEGTITRWNKKEGESFSAGEVLFQIESDYGFAPLEIRAEIPGVLGRILMPEGSTHVPVQQVIALVADRAASPRPDIRIDIPTTPVQASLKTASARTPTSAPVFNTVSLKPRLHHHHVHHHSISTSSISHLENGQSSLLQSSTIHRSPSPSFYDTHHQDGIHSAGVSSVRGMVIDHHSLVCPSPTTPCTSMSSVGCEGMFQGHQMQHEVDTQVNFEAGADLRRKIMSNLARNPSMKGSSNGRRCATTEYFDGIL